MEPTPEELAEFEAAAAERYSKRMGFDLPLEERRERLRRACARSRNEGYPEPGVIYVTAREWDQVMEDRPPRVLPGLKRLIDQTRE